MARHLPVRPNSAGFVVMAGLAAFSCYFCMYAFRKPVAAAHFEGFEPVFGMDFKVALIVFQIIGYALSKWVGVRVIAERSTRRRAASILALMSLSFAGLLGFAVLPAPFNLLMILASSLPLGMIWGFVFGWLEGRRTSEILVAILSASFILASGAVKSAGALLLARGVSETWMPAATAGLFALPLIVSVLVLAHIPPPTNDDRAERRERFAMGRGERHGFLRLAGFPLALLSLSYVGLTVTRDLRDSFAAEIWAESRHGGEPALFTLSEAPIALFILGALALFSAIRDNARAFRVAMAAILAGCLLLIASTLAFAFAGLDVLAWMIASGCGLFLAYVAIGTVVIERLVALGSGAANAGFAVYLIDAMGYTASLGLLVSREVFFPDLNWSGLVTQLALVSGTLGALSALALSRRASQLTRFPVSC